ncbi:Uncharacterised protein [Mycobacteroides abscessus subsp. abscessus]|nr:Uncharacterised protein [Mycobacteroides abscessus subsp. abscessus]
MPAMIAICRSTAICETRVAHGPSSDSAIGPSGTPNRHIVASGNTTRSAPSAAARAAASATTTRLAPGLSLELICAIAMRMWQA